MPEFQPFDGLRYDTARVDLAAVTAPPYDVLDARDRAALLEQHPENAVRIDLPVDEDGRDRYELAAELFETWQADGVLVSDGAPTFTVYRMAFTDEAGVEHHTTGVLGALTLSRPEAGEILPHEHTTPKAKSDRLDLTRATRANLSAIWGLSLAKGLTDLLPIGTAPDDEWTDGDGVTHSVWVVRDADRIASIAAAVGEQPLVIADGHHRYETALNYLEERRTAGDVGDAQATLAYVVELVDEELTVQPIHRLLNNVPADFRDRLARWFELSDAGTIDETAVSRMLDAGALCLIDGDGAVFLRPRPDAFEGVRDLDSSRLDVALDGIDVTYQHGVGRVLDAVGRGDAQAGVLLRPATVAQIEATAHGGERMPPKTTFFHPKPKTGIVFRRL